MSEPSLQVEGGAVLTVEIAELGAELWPADPGRHGPITGSLVVLRSHQDGLADVAAAFIREPHAHGWVQWSTEFPAADAPHWREFEAPVRSFPGPRVTAWLDEVSGGVWFVNTALHPTLHTHRYSGMTLQHDHPQGDRPHGYFGHPEDSGTAHLTGKLTGKPVTGCRLCGAGPEAGTLLPVGVRGAVVVTECEDRAACLGRRSVRT